MIEREGPRLDLAAVAPRELCVTSGHLAAARVDAPNFRAVAPGKAGDAALVRFVAHGFTEQLRALDDGEIRHQLGLKLRATDSCNLVYVMWRLEPKAKIVVSMKQNVGQRTSNECGAGGYANIKPLRAAAPPRFDDGVEHELRAEISGDSLVAWVDGQAVWQSTLPGEASALSGPAGVRSDNVDFEITAFAVDRRVSDQTADASCQPGYAGDDELTRNSAARPRAATPPRSAPAAAR